MSRIRTITISSRWFYYDFSRRSATYFDNSFSSSYYVLPATAAVSVVQRRRIRRDHIIIEMTTTNRYGIRDFHFTTNLFKSNRIREASQSDKGGGFFSRRVSESVSRNHKSGIRNLSVACFLVVLGGEEFFEGMFSEIK